MHPLFQDIQCAAFAHRGGALEAAENTLEAFDYAIGLGFRFIETDVQLTADGVVVIFHDEEMNRLTDLRGRVSDHTWAELSKIKVLGRGAIPRLEDALSAWPEVVFNIDAKTEAVAAPLCQVAKAHGRERLCLASESDTRIAWIRSEMGPGQCTAAASGETARALLPLLAGFTPRAPAADCFQIPVSYRGLPLITRRQLNWAREAGIAVHIWTIDGENQMERLVDKGVGGIMTDRPNLLKQVLKRHDLWG